jgi:hypothetical protein
MAIYKNSPPDTLNFVQAAGITDITQIRAISTLVTDLKYAGIWNKFKAIYPFIGGTATSHKFNLKDPRDVNGAYRLFFSGGWTHSSTGALPNGTNAYADTFLTPSTTLSSINNSSFSFYNRTSNAYSNSPNHGIIPATTTNRMYVADQSPTGYQIWGTENVSFNVSYSNVNRQGFYTAVRTASNSRKTYRNGVVVGSNTGNDTGGALSSISFFIGAANGPFIASTYTNNQIAFSSIGDGLTDTESLAFYTAVQKYQTTLGRQV